MPLFSSLLAGSAVYKICSLPVNIVAFTEVENVLSVLPSKKALKINNFSESSDRKTEAWHLRITGAGWCGLTILSPGSGGFFVYQVSVTHEGPGKWLKHY